MSKKARSKKTQFLENRILVVFRVIIFFIPIDTYAVKKDSTDYETIVDVISQINSENSKKKIKPPVQGCIDYHEVMAKTLKVIEKKPYTPAKLMAIWQQPEVRKRITNKWYDDKNEDLFLLKEAHVGDKCYTCQSCLDKFHECLTNPQSIIKSEHPEFKLFLKKIKNADPTVTEKDVVKIWKLMFQGFIENKVRYAKCFKQVKVKTQNPKLQWVKDSDRVLYCKDKLDYADIPQHHEVAQLVKELLRPNVDEFPGFWSGGIALSIYAKANTKGRKFAMLETTLFGNILNKIMIKKTWPGLNALWNQLSIMYAENVAENLKKVPSSELHVFLRTIDRNSVLMRQELPMIVEKSGNKDDQVKYRLVFGEDDNLVELKLDENGMPIPLTHEAEEAVYDNLDKIEARYNQYLFHSIEHPEFRSTTSYLSLCRLYEKAAEAMKDPTVNYTCNEIKEKLEFKPYPTSTGATDDAAFKTNLQKFLHKYLNTLQKSL